MLKRLGLRVLLVTISVTAGNMWWGWYGVRINSAVAAEEGYGIITGQIVLDGEIPPRPLVVKKDDPTAKDPTVCAAADLPSDALIVDEKTKGIANVFVYLPKAPANIHPDLKASKEKEVVFDQKGCRFVPHVLLARTDQIVRVKSDDACAHNTHTYPVRGQPVNVLLPPNERKGLEFTNKVPETTPMKVSCDIHSWMSAWWLIIDHPYAAISDENGKFKIADLPPGEYVFRVWQEKSGYIERELKVTVTAGKTTDLGQIKAPAAKFKD